MICKFCSAQIADDCELCPECGKPLNQEPDTQEVTEEAVVAETADAAEEAVATPVEENAEIPKVNKKLLVRIAHIAAAVLGLGLLAFVLLVALGVLDLKRADKDAAGTADILYSSNYCVEDEEAAKRANDVVATMGDAKLTNAQLQIYYRMQVLDFVNYFGSYLSTIGMDISLPLSEQTCYYDDMMTWEQYFIDAAIKTWENYQGMVLEAESNGFTLSEEYETELASIPELLETQATDGNYESVDAMLKELLGPGCTVDEYVAYIRLNAIANEYYAAEYEKLMPSDEDVELYFEENEASFTGNGITKESGLVSSVRHILVCPKKDESTDETTPTASTDPTQATEDTGFTEAQWNACYAEAERILEEWKSGEATEDSFAALVPVYSEDGGSLNTGGLYENIDPTSSYVENFLNWAVDMNRQPGDTGIVQTEYGYHIMYFVSGKPYWIEAARTQLLSERTNEFLEEIKARFTAKIRFDKVALSQLELA